MEQACSSVLKAAAGVEMGPGEAAARTERGDVPRGSARDSARAARAGRGSSSSSSDRSDGPVTFSPDHHRLVVSLHERMDLDERADALTDFRYGPSHHGPPQPTTAHCGQLQPTTRPITAHHSPPQPTTAYHSPPQPYIRPF